MICVLQMVYLSENSLNSFTLECNVVYSILIMSSVSLNQEVMK